MEHPPWLPQPAHWADLTVAAQDAHPASMLNLYRAALAERRRNPALGDGTLTWDDDAPDGVLSFTREPGFRCVVNFGPGRYEIPEGAEVSSRPASPGPVRWGWTRRSGCASRLRRALPTGCGALARLMAVDARDPVSRVRLGRSPEPGVGQVQAVAECSDRRRHVEFCILVRVSTSTPLVPSASSVITDTWFSPPCTTYKVFPRTSRPSPPVTKVPPRSTWVATPVSGSTRNRRPVLDWTTSKAFRLGVSAMPFALNPLAASSRRSAAA